MAQVLLREFELNFEDIKNVIDFYIDEKSEFITGQILYLGGVNG